MEWCEILNCWCSDVDFAECEFECECNECMFCEIVE